MTHSPIVRARSNYTAPTSEAVRISMKRLTCTAACCPVAVMFGMQPNRNVSIRALICTLPPCGASIVPSVGPPKIREAAFQGSLGACPLYMPRVDGLTHLNLSVCSSSLLRQLRRTSTSTIVSQQATFVFTKVDNAQAPWRTYQLLLTTSVNSRLRV